MHVRYLSVTDFRSYPTAELSLAPGVTTLVGPNGQGKTNLVEAVGYLSSLASHRVATDLPLVRYGAERAVIRGLVERDGRETLLELELNPGRANRAQLNRTAVPRPREVLGAVRTVLFAPEDLALVKGEPSGRRAFLDDLLVQRQPRWAAVRADHDRVLKQRNALLRSAAPVLRPGRGRTGFTASGQPVAEARAGALHTLDVWDSQLSLLAAQLLHGRLRLLSDLGPHVRQAYETVSAAQSEARAEYRATLPEDIAGAVAAGQVPEVPQLRDQLQQAYAQVRGQEIERGLTLVGPHRDDVHLALGRLPARGYASHGESWSFALALKLGAFQLLRADLDDDPVLVLDDVFAELDSGRRDRLATMVEDCEQVLVTAAVGEDVPDRLGMRGATFDVSLGEVRRAA